MGTRADFYVKKNDQYTWHGSIAWDGYPEGISKSLLKSKSEDEFLAALEKFLSKKNGITEKWPWPWVTSKLTDYSYILDVNKGVVFISAFGDKTITPYQIKEWNKILKEADEDDEVCYDTWLEKNGHFYPRFPNMKI